MMKGKNIFDSIEKIQNNIIDNKEEIERLDQQIGDGDHIFNILRGLEEISKLRELLIDEPIDQVFKQSSEVTRFPIKFLTIKAD